MIRQYLKCSNLRTEPQLENLIDLELDDNMLTGSIPSSLGNLKKLNWVVLLIVLEAATGIAMYYFDFPALSQPLHLVLASLLFGFQFYVFLEVINTAKANKTL